MYSDTAMPLDVLFIWATQTDHGKADYIFPPAYSAPIVKTFHPSGVHINNWR